MNRTALKSRSKSSMLWARPGVLLVCMTYWLIRWVIEFFVAVEIPVTQAGIQLSAVLDSPRTIAALLLGLAVSVLVQVLAAGHDYNYPLKLSRGEASGIKSLFELAGRPGRFIALPLLLRSITTLPLLPALGLAAAHVARHWAYLNGLAGQLIGGVAAGVDPAALQDVAIGLMSGALPAFFWPLMAVGGALSVFLWLTYAQAVFLAIDSPELSLRQCLRQSRGLMQGRRGEYLAMTLSFLPWFIPLLLSGFILLSASFWALMGLGSALLLAIWALAYMHITYANYFSLITGRLKKDYHPGVMSVDALQSLLGNRPDRRRSFEDDGEDAPEEKPQRRTPPPTEEEEAERQRLIDEMWKK